MMQNVEKIKKLISTTDDMIRFIEGEEFYKEYNSNELIESIRSINEKLKKKKYTVAVIAAMKAGKSTLFNSILGEDILPNETAACTVAITEIKYSNKDANRVQKHLKNGQIIDICAAPGASVQEKFLNDIRETRSRDQVKDVDKYYIEHTIECLNNQEYRDLVENFVLIDTPGPNEAGNGEFDTRELKETAYYQLRNADAIIFVLDYQVYKSDTNAALLNDIFAGRQDIQKDSEKIFFVINKLDARTSKDGSREEILETVKKMIVHQTQGVINSPQIIGLSALMALYGRAIMNKNISPDSLKDCNEKYSAKYSKKVIVDGEEYFKLLKEEELAQKLIEESGIQEFEKKAVLDTFYRASDKMVIGSKGILADKLESMEKEISSTIDIQNKGIDELKKGISRSKQEIGELTSYSHSLFEQTRGNVLGLNKEIESRVKGISGEIQEVINSTLKNYEDYYESTDKSYLDRISADLARSCKNAVENFVLRKQDEIIRLYTDYRNRISMEIYQNMSELSRRADTIIKKNLDIEVKTGSMFSMNVEEGSFKAEISKAGNESNVMSNEDFEKQSKRGMKAAATGALIGAEVAGPIGALVGGIAGFLLGIGTYQEQAPVRQIAKYKLDTTEMKQRLKSFYMEESRKMQSSFENYINGEIQNIENTIDTAIELFISQVNGYLDGLVKEYESKKGEREKYIAYLNGLSGKVAEFKSHINF